MTKHEDYPIDIELFPAGNGDAMLVTMGDDIIMIDGGYAHTYNHHMKSRLLELSKQGKQISKLVITHIDADHIRGAISFLEDNGFCDKPESQVIPVKEIWFNSFRHMNIDKKPGKLLESEKIKLRTLRHDKDPDTSGGPVSTKEGSTLGGNILLRGYSWNKDFNGGPVMAGVHMPIEIEKTDIKITILTPTIDALDRLKHRWFKELPVHIKNKMNEDDYFDDAFEKMLEFVSKPKFVSKGDVSGQKDMIKRHLHEWILSRDEDTSETNASSITFIIEFRGKKLLFLGDAIPSLVLGQLEKLMGDQFPKDFDIIKVAHHGGFKNNSPKLLRSIRAKHYLFSSNGKKHNHPDIETIAWLLDQNKDIDKILHFNYRQERLKFLQNIALQSRYRYVLGEAGANGYIKITV